VVVDRVVVAIHGWNIWVTFIREIFLYTKLIIQTTVSSQYCHPATATATIRTALSRRVDCHQLRTLKPPATCSNSPFKRTLPSRRCKNSHSHCLLFATPPHRQYCHPATAINTIRRVLSRRIDCHQLRTLIVTATCSNSLF
jgi:hypothetical protein